MIPLTLADEIRTTLLDYLTTTFNFQDAAVETALLEFLQHPRDGLFKGPYVHLRLPFRTAAPDTQVPLDIRPPFAPYVHQLRAFERLTTRNDHTPQPTIVTTGTGSGKTECFLYPVLDYCYAHRGEPGIKAIILYPMNALAADQSARLAKMLWNDPRLKDQITAGMYIGGEGDGLHRTLGPDFLIEDRVTLRNHPPDILLTNFKMLDFLLLRPEDKTLWMHNTPTTLRYLVLDELHTYDGAQGSDVACLIRRLKERLHIPNDNLCPVGTSATVASEQGNTIQDLTQFAAQVFGVPFATDSVIGETRVDLTEFLPNAPSRDTLPTDVDALTEQTGESYADYIARQTQVWFGNQPGAIAQDPLALAATLREHSFLRTLLASSNDEILPWDELIERVTRWDTTFAAFDPETQRAILQSFLALIAHAKTGDTKDPRPFLTCQVQLWVREMSRLMREVSAAPGFFWRDDVPLNSTRHGLPAYYCRDCGHTGWLTVLHEGDDVLHDDYRAIIKAYFDKNKNVRYVYPLAIASNDTARNPDLPERLPGMQDRICPQCLGLSTDEHCRACECATFPVHIHREVSTPSGNEAPKDLQRCPMCGTDGALSIVGSQAASLSSVAISHLYTSPLNDDKKLLAFTDSVQDASHRASFFGARTYRFNLRTAFQSALPNDSPIVLDKLTDHILAHWRDRWKNRAKREQHLAATFMPPDLHEMNAYRQFIDETDGPMPPALEHDLRERLSWEVLMEYGFTARLGRSLEKVASSTAYLDPGKLRTLVENLTLLLREEIGLLKEIPDDAVRCFVAGLLERTRTRGGVVHPLLRKYAEDQGNWYLLTKKMQPLLSPFHKHSPRFPKFLTDTPQRDVFDLYLTSGARKTWYVDWAQRALSASLGISDINEIYRTTIKLLVDQAILHKYAKGNANAYGIEPSVLFVTRHTASVYCQTCGHEQTVTAATLNDWLGRPCLNYQCVGAYAVDSHSAQHYYRTVYARGQVERIFPHEHTGLLKREVREQVEKQFKRQISADAPNLLAATSTLELGIDIGDLSATMACSVPPATANYLQRIGRAGRKTGTSLILTIANAQPHDLYFFEEPLEMIAGTIVPPGCFIDAPEMLKRQFLAFGIDTWTATTPARALPRNVQEMLARYKRDGFPAPFLEFYQQHKSELIERFLGLFADEISQVNQARLRGFAQGNELVERVIQAIADVETEREDLRNARRTFKERYDRVKADPAQYEKPDEEIARLEREMNLLVQMIRELEDKYILNFFTDAGLLPNYAFPETGVKFKAIITGLEGTRNGGPGYMVREYIRAAPLAIRELAPFNTFYAEGRKLPVDHIETGGQEQAIEQWQFCDQCAHLELVQASHYHASCPNCGSVKWNDVGQKHEMVRFHHASAWVDHNTSLVGDDDDERERKTYQIGAFFDIPRQQVNSAYLLPNLPFGFEYLDRVTMREVNFGSSETLGQKITVCETEFTENGFQVCHDCGVVVNGPQAANSATPPQHTRNCLSRGNNRQPEWNNLYLYREVTSEALRILLPVSTTLVDEKITTFEACIDLGLRRWFRGDPEHLQIRTHTEPALDGSRRRFLVIYDTIPGGTSYLRDLVRPENFFRVLRLALDTLTSCRCRLDPAKQACYRCLYSYRSQRNLELISRALGVEMLGSILAQQSNLETIPTLSDAHIDSLIESELEQRFIDALQKYANENKQDCSWHPILRNGKRAWEFKAGNTKWWIEPQVVLDETYQVRTPSKADFVFFSTQPNQRPIAVFTDGFAYHVRPNETFGNLGDDLLKRCALLDSGQFVVWSITWDDVKEFEDQAPFALHLFANQQRQFDRVAHESRSPLSARLMRENAIAQLIEYLKFPDRPVWMQTVHRFLLVSAMPLRPSVDESVVQALTDTLRTQPAMPVLTIPDNAPAGTHAYEIISARHNTLLMHTPQASLRDAVALSLTVRLDDMKLVRGSQDFRQDWRQFLLLCNLYQFLPGFVPITSELIERYGMPQRTSEPAPARTSSLSTEWAQAFEYANPVCDDLLNACLSAGIGAPVVGHELAQDNRIVASAELAWPAQRVAVLLGESDGDRSAFTATQWKVWLLTERDAILDALGHSV